MAALAVSAAAVLSACYDYVRPPRDAPVPGSEVRVALTDAGSLAVAPSVGPRVETVDGRLTSVGADSVVLGATETTQYDGTESTWRGERVAVPRSAISSMSVRRLNGTKTALIGVAAVGALVALIAGFKLGKTGSATVIHGGQTPQ